MPIRVQCPQCGQEYNVGDDKAGRRFQCKGCQSSVVVPTAAAANEEDPFAGMDEDFSAGFMSQGTKPTSGNRSTSGKKGNQGSKGKSESSGSGAALGIGIGLAAVVIIAAGVFFFMRGGDDGEAAPAGGGGNDNVANGNNGAAGNGNNAPSGPSGNTLAGNNPAPSGSGAAGTTAPTTPAHTPTLAELNATMLQLKQIVLGMHGYHDTWRYFPVSSSSPDALRLDGTPHLSWRVHLLPFLDQQNLYDQFHLNEPWDSPNNLPLADLMPAIFRSPGDEPAATTTRFVVFSGRTAPFDGGLGKHLADFRDGTSNTILVAQAPADRAVPWTKPEDIVFDAADPLACIGAIPQEGLPVGMADGACFYLSPQADATMFANFVQPADSQIVDNALLLNEPENYVPFVPPSTPPSGPLHLAYMPADCIGLVRIAPRTIMQTAWLTGALPPEMTVNAPVPLDSLEEAIFWIVPRTDAPVPGEPDDQFALSFTQPTAPAELPLSQGYDGNAYLHSDDTIVFVKDDRFEQMFAGIGAENPLPGSLRADQLDADVYIAFQLQSPTYSVDWSKAEPMLLPAGELGNGLMLAEQFQLAFRASESPLLQVWLTFPDDAAATRFKTALEQQAPLLLDSRKSDPIGGPLATLLANAWSVSQEGPTMSLEIAHSDALCTELASIVTEVMAPAVMSNPELNGEQRTQNNFHQILLASHNYHDLDVFNSFPVPTAIEHYFEEDGKPFLSWRVHLLPYLDEIDLYQEFNFDEPWDSEHNIQLLERMPAVYQIEDGYSAELDPGMTRIVRADGEGALFQNGRGAHMRDITDGLTNTAFCFAVGPEHAVAWTKPEDIVIDFSQPIMPQLGLPEGENFLVGMCDGVVPWVLPTIDDENLRRLFQHNDGEILEIPFAP